MSASAGTIRIGAGLSSQTLSVQAADRAAQACAESLEGARADLAFVFFSSHHIDSAASIVSAIERRLNPACLIGVSGEGTLGGEVELEGTPGVSVLAAALPGVTVKPFTTADLPQLHHAAATDEQLQAIRENAGLHGGIGGSAASKHRATFLFVDPNSVPMHNLLPAMVKARTMPDPLTAAGLVPPAGPFDPDAKPGPIIGGIASASVKPGGNVLVMNDRLLRSGGVGVSLSGRVRVDTLVSQGCRPIGQRYVVTGVKGQLVTALGGRPAIEVLKELLDSLSESERDQLKRGLFLGRAIDARKARFGRDDFLIRNVYGVDQSSDAIAVMDLLKPGQTVQFHLRDQNTATEDLALLLDAQQLYDRPAGALLFTCNGRGSRLFDSPNHDAEQVVKAFARVAAAGEEAAKAGFPMGHARAPESERPLPLAGFFAAGEIGPVGDQVFVHGQTACLALFREIEAG